MKAVVQRVLRAQVSVNERVIGRIGPGLMVLLGVGKGDTDADADYLAHKITGLRVFEDAAGKMNESLQQTGGALLVVSQFTLFGDTRKGKRPSFDGAAPPEEALRLYERFIMRVQSTGIDVQTGEFRAHMVVELVNDGPVTLVCESPESRSSRFPSK